MSTENGYHPLLDTLRLYAGWLFGFLFVIFAVGGYAFVRNFAMRTSIIGDWVTSPLLLRVAFSLFVFLMLGSLHRATGRGLWKAIAFAVLGFFLIVAFLANT